MYISIPGVTASIGFALTASHFEERNAARRKVTKRSCPFRPVLLSGPAAIGYPWPFAANPASMPGCPLRRTCARPAEGARKSKADQKPKRGGLRVNLTLMSARSSVGTELARDNCLTAGDFSRLYPDLPWLLPSLKSSSNRGLQVDNFPQSRLFRVSLG